MQQQIEEEHEPPSMTHQPQPILSEQFSIINHQQFTMGTEFDKHKNEDIDNFVPKRVENSSPSDFTLPILKEETTKLDPSFLENTSFNFIEFDTSFGEVSNDKEQTTDPYHEECRIKDAISILKRNGYTITKQF